MPRRLTTEEFIEKARKVHGGKYDYSLVKYKNSHTKIEIVCPDHGEFYVVPTAVIHGKVGCAKCSNDKLSKLHSKGKEQFISDARKVHGDKYDYSLVKYKNTGTKVKITCPVHGEFVQIPNDHIRGHGCKICGSESRTKKKTKTKEQFITQCRQVHGNKFDYSKVVYKNNRTKVKIICPDHGEFEQTPHVHIRGHGCRKCGGTNPKTTNEFIREARKIHGNKFDYSKVVYKNNHAKVKIICPVHGTFQQIATDHIRGSDWNKCAYDRNATANRKTISEFIREARKIHGNKFDYSKVVYKNALTKVKIICPVHAKFSQTPSSHLQGIGCPRCKESKGEKLVGQILAAQSVTFETQKRFDTCRNKKPLPFDFFIPSKNLLIEYDGRQHFFDISFFNAIPFSQQKKHDAIKTKWASDNGYSLLRIPYTDSPETIETKILAYL